MAIPVGSALGYVLGERVARSGLGPWGAGVPGTGPESWPWAFYLVVAPGLALGIWSFFMREPPRGQTDLGRAAAPVAVRWRDYSLLLRTPSYVFCTLGMTAMTFAIGGIAFWMPTYLKQRPGTGDSPITVFGAIVVVAGLVATYSGGRARASPAILTEAPRSGGAHCPSLDGLGTLSEVERAMRAERLVDKPLHPNCDDPAYPAVPSQLARIFHTLCRRCDHPLASTAVTAGIPGYAG